MKINVERDSSGAVQVAQYLAQGPHIPMPGLQGSFSGARIGDQCYRTRDLSAHDYAGLVVVRGPVAYTLTLKGHRKNGYDVRIEIERLAKSLVDRVDAVIALKSSPQMTESVSGRAVDARQVQGKPIVLMDEYASAVGATVKVDMLGGTAEITKSGRSLNVNIGRKEAWLDGKPMTLAFPALRHGGKQVYCPLETLALL